MQHQEPIRVRPALSCAKRQSGQALIYGLFVLVGGLAALFFMFNTGQLVGEKTKLVNTADAVAYSAGTMHARALNFEAYANRAMVANTVAIAQMVSLSSWAQYAENLGQYGIVANNPKFFPFQAPYNLARSAGGQINSRLHGSLGIEDLAKASDRLAHDILANAQRAAYLGLVPARHQLMQEVAQANYRGDGDVTVDPVPLTATEFTDFVSRRSGDERARFAEVVRTAANKDRFVPRRSWWLPALWSDCATASPRVDWFDRRGGTELIGLDEWKAMDTLSEKRWVPRNKFDVFCTAVAETPAGWGGRTAADESSVDLDPRHYDYSMLINPLSSVASVVTSSSWGYSGLPSFYDLSPDALAQDDPRLRFAIRVRRQVSETATSEGRSAIAPSARLNAYRAQPAGGSELVAASASEAFFRREGDAANNAYGASIGKPRELGSLFNPYWQARLIQADGEVRAAQVMQGALLP